MTTFGLLAILAAVRPGPTCTAASLQQTLVIQEVITSINTGSPPRMLEVARNRWSGADTSSDIRQQVLSQLGVAYWKSREWRPATPCRIDDNEAYVLAENQLSEETDSLVFTFDRASKVVGLLAWTGVRVAVASLDTLNDVARARALRAYVDRYRKAGVFSGAIFVQQDGRVLFADSMGVEHRPATRPIGINSRINIASIGKIFTATAVMQLVNAGALTLDDSLGRFYADSELAPPLRAVPIRYLLCHTSGIHDSRTALASTPGAQYFYSNLEYVMLGEIVERVGAERRFEDYFAEHIFRPAGMTRTSRAVLSRPVDYLAMGYVPGFADSGVVFASNSLLHTLPGNGAGALFSTASDLARFGAALRSGLLVPRALVDSMRTPCNGSVTLPYGFGVMYWRSPRIWGHAGDLPGTDADLEILEPRGVISVVLSNFSGVNNPIRRRIARLWGIVAR